jgi:endo-1,4-beta-xylanase
VATLVELGRKAGLEIGVGVTHWWLDSDTAYLKLAKTQFGLWTPWNVLIWDYVEPHRGVFNWTDADNTMARAKAANIAIRGHRLCGPQSNPAWLDTLNAADLRVHMDLHIDTVLKRYPTIKYWDVVNELIAPNGSYRSLPFRKAFVSDYAMVKYFFNKARAANPNARLFYNGHNINEINTQSTAVYNLCKRLCSEHIPIHGVGLQGEFTIGTTDVQLDSVKRNIARFQALGLEVQFTEIRIPLKLQSNGNATLKDLTTQASLSYKLVHLAAQSGIKVYSHGQISDKYSPIPQRMPGFGAAHIYDKVMKPKPAYHKTAQALTELGS